MSEPGKEKARSAVRREPSMGEAVTPLLAGLLLLGVGHGYLRLSVEPLLLLAAIVAGLVGLRLGARWEELQGAIVAKIADSMPALLILVAVGFLIGAWMFSGTVPLLIYYGLALIEPRFMIVAAFVITAIVSTATGTSWGALGTVGVALIGVAEALGAPLAVTAGAIVSGAYFGDKISPLSDTTNLAPLAAGSELYEHIRHLLYTTVPAALFALFVYLVVGLGVDGRGYDLEGVGSIQLALAQMYDLSPILLLPVGVVFYGAFTSKPTVPTMIFAGLLAIVLGVALHSFQLADGLRSVVSGFEVTMTGASEVDGGLAALLHRGGMVRMAKSLLLVLCAFSFAGIVSEIGCLRVILRATLRAIGASKAGLILATIASTSGVAMITGDAYLAIIVPGDLFRDAYPERGLHPKNLSRTLEDSGTVIMPLIPWAVAAAYVQESLGVSVFDYGPWALVCYLGVAFATFYALTGLTLAPAASSPLRPL